MINIRKYFNIWRQNALYTRYDNWCEIHADELIEQAYSNNIENELESIYWCWSCKYSDCERH